MKKNASFVVCLLNKADEGIEEGCLHDRQCSSVRPHAVHKSQQPILVSPRINQSTNQPVNQPTNQTVNQPINESINHQRNNQQHHHHHYQSASPWATHPNKGNIRKIKTLYVAYCTFRSKKSGGGGEGGRAAWTISCHTA